MVSVCVVVNARARRSVCRTHLLASPWTGSRLRWTRHSAAVDFVGCWSQVSLLPVCISLHLCSLSFYPLVMTTVNSGKWLTLLIRYLGWWTGWAQGMM